MKEPNFYMQNMQQLLHLAAELHNRGYGKLRVEPSLSPSGMYWRCKYMNGSDEDIYVSNWFQDKFDIRDHHLELTLQELADTFVEQHKEWLMHCIGDDDAYKIWYKEMLEKLDEGELPYAFCDYYHDPDFWETSESNKISTFK